MDLPEYEYLRRPEVAAILPLGAGSVLDVGCGRGGFGESLRATYPTARLTAIEPVDAMARDAENNYDEVLRGFFPDVLADRPNERFDVVVFNDVIEHIFDSTTLLSAVTQRLSPRGVIVASIPNVRFLKVSAALLFRGQWEYTDDGILDRTHVRFFTRASITTMFADAGYTVEKMVGLNAPWDVAAKYRPLQVIPRRFRDVFYLQYGVIARPRAAALTRG